MGLRKLGFCLVLPNERPQQMKWSSLGAGARARFCRFQAIRVDYVNTHGTSTPVGDAREIQALRDTFGDDIPHLSSTKSLTGHSLGATGVQEAIYCLLIMQDDFLAASAHIEEIDPDFADMPILRERLDNAKVDTVMSNSFGFGGTNATLCFSRV